MKQLASHAQKKIQLENKWKMSTKINKRLKWTNNNEQEQPHNSDDQHIPTGDRVF